MNARMATMYDYHVWANKRVIAHLQSLPSELFAKPVNMGFASIAEVLGHLAAAEGTWLARLKGESPAVAAPMPFSTVKEAGSYFEQLHEQYRACLSELSDVERIVTYRNAKGQTCQNSVEDILTQVIHHGTYHRGNMTTMLRSLGYAGIQTDYMAYVWTISC